MKGFMMRMLNIINAVNVYSGDLVTHVQHVGAVGLQKQVADMRTRIAKPMLPTYWSDC
jgi:hypothetical protein